MKYTLKDYQTDAVVGLLEQLERARNLHRTEGTPVSTSLSATTGAGKTVMAAAVMETLFYGNDDLGFDPDPGAVVIWFSDDPNLNEQTKNRIREASDKIPWSNLITIQPPFAVPRLSPGKVYFLNTQKLSKSSSLTRGHVDTSPAEQDYLDPPAPGDDQAWTIWQTVANTVNDPNMTVYLIVDEAHRGFNTRTSRDKGTLVSKLVNGHAGYPAIPVVVGISATIERFKEAMREADALEGRRQLEPVTVDGFRVQESGLVKDTISFFIPNEAGPGREDLGSFDMALVALGADRLLESQQRWRAYAQAQGSTETVVPLLVLQTPATPDPDLVGLALDTIFELFPEWSPNAVRHVFGEHQTLTFGGWEVDWIEPQRVEETTQVRVLVAKEAISTGWDCPRAEVMVSFRRAKDHTHMTQLLGRMVRSPLARRVPGDEKLNTVECILPNFDRTTAGKVVRFLTGQGDEVTAATGKAVLDERVLLPNPNITEDVWACWDALPTQTIPQRGSSAAKRLVMLGLELSRDRLRPGAVAEATQEIVRVLDAESVRRPELLQEAVGEIWAVRVQSITGRSTRAGLTYEEFAVRADDRAIQVGFSQARKAFSGEISHAYVRHLAATGDDDDSLREAYVKTSALATVPAVRNAVDRACDEIADAWLKRYRAQIRDLPDERRQRYDDVQALAVEPQRTDLGRPRTRVEDGMVIDVTGQQALAPTVEKHLMSEPDGTCPIGSLNEWERRIVEDEVADPSCVGWYRNPPRQSPDSLGVAYQDELGNWRSMHPDFVFFHRREDGTVVASIVDPHGHHLQDTTPKLKGLARFAATFGSEFDRIEAISKVGNHMRVLDMKDDDVRDYIEVTDERPDLLYAGPHAVNYTSPHRR